MTFNPDNVRINAHIGSDMVIADCLLPGCGWRMSFTPVRLAQIIEVCAEHPCKSELINDLRIVADMTPNEGMQYLRMLLARHDKATEMGA
jgi:hypothetical protein